MITNPEDTGLPVIAGRIGPPVAPIPPFEHDDLRPTWCYWDRYADWRRTKCEPRDLSIESERLTEIDQATHEFVGEVAELGELLYTKGAEAILTHVGTQMTFLHEVGDIFFCGVWCLDAWNVQVFKDHVDRSPFYVSPVDAAKLENPEAALVESYIVASFNAGLLSNSFKKLRYQHRSQDPYRQATRVGAVFKACTLMLALNGLGISDALERNVTKLDHRYPAGYVGPGGGIRTGEGA